MEVEGIQREFRVSGVREEDADEAVGFGVRKPLDENAVDDAEDGAVGADAEGQRQRDDDGEGGIGPQLPEGIAEILQGVLDETGASGFAAVFADLLVAAEGETGAAARFGFGKAGLPELLDFVVEVKAELVVELAFDGAAAKESAQAITQIIPHGDASGAFENLGDGGGELVPAFGLGFELLSAAASELVVFGAAVVVGGAPFGLDPATALEAVKGGIERTLLDAEDVARYLLDALGDGPAVLRAEGKSLEDEQVEGALRKVDAFGRQIGSPFWLLHEEIVDLL